MAARIFTIAPSAPFADTLARGLIAQLGDGPLALAEATIYLPTRRAQRTFGDAFARVLGGAALLPRFKALGDAEEDEFLFDADALDLPPAIAPMRRTLLLAMMVRRWHHATRGEDKSFAQAAALADGLAGVMDEVETQGAKLSDLDNVVPNALAAHWDQVRDFLKLLETQWPALLAAEDRIAPADRRNRALRGLAERMRNHPPQGPVIAAGSTGSIPATAELLRAIAESPNGSVVLPGLDRELDAASWADLEPGHPQFGMKQLLERLGVPRAEVQDWDGTRDPKRERVLREALRPAPTTDAWRAIAEAEQQGEIAEGLSGLTLVEAADPAQEATVIALILREALEEPGKTATLVTPDRALARRVASELARWDVEADDSAGQPLAHTPPGTFLCLLAEGADSGFAPVALLALLKHPLCTLSDEPAAFRAQVRQLDMVLRGPRPNPGLTGIRDSIARARADAHENAQAALSRLQYWFAKVSAALQPLETALDTKTLTLSDICAAHLSSAAALAGPALWAGQAGEVAARFVEEFIAAAQNLPAIEPGAYAALFRKLAMAKAVRQIRGGHPRVAILGPLEARLQSADTLVIGGLNEGTWPRSPGADPWFSRPMRKALGLEQPERAIGQAAHDFAMLAAGPRVVLTRSQKSDGVPAIASRWVQRLSQLATGLGLRDEKNDILKPQTDYLALAQSLGDSGVATPVKRPAPRPPVAARPKRLSITEIERWVRDPYAIYARRVLGLDVLDPLDSEIGPLERGNAVHKALERFVKENPGPLGDDAALILISIADQVFAAEGTPKAALALWRPRFANAALWFIEQERQLREARDTSLTEIKGRWKVTPEFELRGIADRIDILPDGSAAIFDYKTGKPPRPKQIKAFLAPQLLLEAEMLRQGAFGDPRDAAALLYVWFSGGRDPGAIEEVDLTLVPETVERLKRYIALFAQETTPYLPRLRPQNVDYAGDYDHLARVREWSLGGWDAPDE
ncbi:MAG TPA: double-strand break repair protein AddB [Rhizomicrobium sp.]|nr:double-strand break repair protein AddB [Rhizomicrobium sp.]